ncbi:Serine protease grass [Trichinella pseudospiralis]
MKSNSFLYREWRIEENKNADGSVQKSIDCRKQIERKQEIIPLLNVHIHLKHNDAVNILYSLQLQDMQRRMYIHQMLCIIYTEKRG